MAHPKSIVQRSGTETRRRNLSDSDDDELRPWKNSLEYWNKNKAKLTERYGSLELSKLPIKKRVPRYYSVNENRTLLIILQGDITRTVVDAIVNAANEHMTGGGGVDGVIHRAAGSHLYTACTAHKQIHDGIRLPTGHSRILLSYNMSRTTYYIINTAGPAYNERKAQTCAKQLASCYKTALDLANLYDLETIGFTAISCGIFGYPTADGADVALRAVDKHAGSLPVVLFVLRDDHIYDGWVKKADELQLAPFDPDSPAWNELEVVHTEKLENDDQPEADSPGPYRKVVRDLSTPVATNKPPNDDDEVRQAVETLPDVPDEVSDSQKTDILDTEENSMNIEGNLHPQKTIEMASADSESKLPAGDAPEQEQGETSQPSSRDKTETNTDPTDASAPHPMHV